MVVRAARAKTQKRKNSRIVRVPNLIINDRAIKIGSAVAEELPRVSNFADLVHIKIGDNKFVLIAASFGEDLPARIAKIALAVKLADVPRSFGTDAVYRPDEISVRDRVCRLLELPEIFAQTRDSRRRIENYLGAVQPEASCTFGKVAVVANINADPRDRRIETRIAEIAGTKIELFPKAGSDVRDVRLAILAEVFAIRIDNGGGVVIDARLLLFIDRDDEHHAELLRNVLHQFDGRPIGNFLDRLVPTRLLLGTEIRRREDLLKAKDLHTFSRRVFDELHLMVDVRLLD